MPQIEIFKTETLGDHLTLLTLMHSYAQHHPKTLLELDYHQVPSQRAVYKLRPQHLSSTYHLGDATIQHVTEAENYHIGVAGRSKKIREKASRKLERLTSITLTKLEESLEQ